MTNKCAIYVASLAANATKQEMYRVNNRQTIIYVESVDGDYEVTVTRVRDKLKQ